MTKLINHLCQDVVFIYSSQQCGADDPWVNKQLPCAGRSPFPAQSCHVHRSRLCTNKSSFPTGLSRKRIISVTEQMSPKSAGLGERHGPLILGETLTLPWSQYGFLLTFGALTRFVCNCLQSRKQRHAWIHQSVSLSFFLWLSKHLHQR